MFQVWLKHKLLVVVLTFLWRPLRKTHALLSEGPLIWLFSDCWNLTVFYRTHSCRFRIIYLFDHQALSETVDLDLVMLLWVVFVLDDWVGPILRSLLFGDGTVLGCLCSKNEYSDITLWCLLIVSYDLFPGFLSCGWFWDHGCISWLLPLNARLEHLLNIKVKTLNVLWGYVTPFSSLRFSTLVQGRL